MGVTVPLLGVGIDGLLDALAQVRECLVQIPLQLGACGLAVSANLMAESELDKTTGYQRASTRHWGYLVQLVFGLDHLVHVDLLVARRVVCCGSLAWNHVEYYGRLFLCGICVLYLRLVDKCRQGKKLHSIWLYSLACEDEEAATIVH